MANAFLAETPFLRDVLWQTTLSLSLGVLAAFIWSRQPARAHRLLLLAMIAAVLTPLLSYAVRQKGWGLFARAEAVATEPAVTSPQTDLTFTTVQSQKSEPVRYTLSS